MLTQDEKLLLIGQVTNLSKIPIRTIRYYESLGLIKSSKRTEGGFRQFSLDVLTRLAFIKRAQNFGLSLEEIGDILQVYDQGQAPCGEIQEKLEEKVLQIDRQIDQLLTLRSEIKGLLSGWQNMDNQHEDTICPNMQNTR
ncbi:heavy metal-responsive transcriptional regulator [Nostoc sp. FACHB-973]|uniref:Heavy metal-responsive transcriptional regulator n=1 Tax=Desmonostoc muscorum LEGE 12446 TaxID=1828758 RepID=A0A8J7AE74_DESMC|nr:heavy metal-responsive transcriptional regulator [Desmonostoc muscorum]MBD2516282.1 heavy metal-responsive transcriptional regulator [Nostoc sp. FACHB-973]MBX9253551.1 heavy metal-responsive transcriptional regulator [Desmonostoc muscorum CCALA 125]MCF2149392.1 heavy metal-responsive transcriptional regulator [Desmonostoc muscorum LEGE 12446]